MMTHIMLDIETMGKSPGCKVAAIGACVFDDEAIVDQFYRVINIEHCPGVIDPATVRWWLRQPDEARLALADNEATWPQAALGEFEAWCRHMPDKRFWCHGATFDVPVLDWLYRELIILPPWDYKSARDTRTIFDLADYRLPQIDGGKHHALHDAIAQARGVQVAYRLIGRRLDRRPVTQSASQDWRGS